MLVDIHEEYAEASEPGGKKFWLGHRNLESWNMEKLVVLRQGFNKLFEKRCEHLDRGNVKQEQKTNNLKYNYN